MRAGATRCYTSRVPTTRPRHTITETPQVKECLDEVRAKLPKGQKIDYAEHTTLQFTSEWLALPGSL